MPQGRTSPLPMQRLYQRKLQKAPSFASCVKQRDFSPHCLYQLHFRFLHHRISTFSTPTSASIHDPLYTPEVIRGVAIRFKKAVKNMIALRGFALSLNLDRLWIPTTRATAIIKNPRMNVTEPAALRASENALQISMKDCAPLVIRASP